MEATFNNFLRNVSRDQMKNCTTRLETSPEANISFQDSWHFFFPIISPFEKSSETKNPRSSKHDRMHMRINGEKGEEKEREEERKKKEKEERAACGFAVRIAPCLYNNVIAANEENWYKIAGSSGPIRGGPRGSSAHTRVGDRAGRSPMAAAPPRQLPFRWKCDGCPLFRMIKYRRKNGAETRALVFCNHANRGPENSRSSPPPPSLSFRRMDVRPFSCPLLFSNRLSIVKGREKARREAETRGRTSNAIFIYTALMEQRRENERGILNRISRFN